MKKKRTHFCFEPGCVSLATHVPGREYREIELRPCEGGCGLVRRVRVSYYNWGADGALKAYFTRLCGACSSFARAAALRREAAMFEDRGRKLLETRRRRAAKVRS